MTDAANPTPKKEVKPVGTLEMVSYSMGNAANSLIMLGTGTYLNFFWTDIAMIPLAAMGTILSFARFLGIGTDILMGFLLDRTKNKHGKARPWILWMALPMLISYLALFYVPNMSETGRIVYAFITYNLVAFFTMSALALPMQSLLALITNDPKKRLTMSMLNMSVGTLFQILGNMAVMPAINALGGGQQGYFRFFGILGVIGTALYLLVFFGTTERVTQEESEEKKEEKISVREVIRLYLANKWWIIMTFFQGFSFLYPSFMAINMYYMTWVMGNPALMGPFQSIMSAAMLITLIVGTPIVPRIGKIYASFLALV